MMLNNLQQQIVNIAISEMLRNKYIFDYCMMI